MHECLNCSQCPLALLSNGPSKAGEAECSMVAHSHYNSLMFLFSALWFGPVWYTFPPLPCLTLLARCVMDKLMEKLHVQWFEVTRETSRHSTGFISPPQIYSAQLYAVAYAAEHNYSHTTAWVFVTLLLMEPRASAICDPYVVSFASLGPVELNALDNCTSLKMHGTRQTENMSSSAGGGGGAQETPSTA